MYYNLGMRSIAKKVGGYDHMNMLIWNNSHGCEFREDSMHMSID